MKFQVLTLIVLISMLFAVVINQNIPSVKAQGQTTVNVLSSIGGTTSPDAGNYTYTSGSSDTFTATPDDSDIFLYWIVQSSAGANTITDNPTTITFTQDNYNIQAVFQPLNATLPPIFAPSFNSANWAIVVVVAGLGGTTNPSPGVYAYANATTVNLTATPNSGWEFSHWVISGGPLTGHGAFPFTDTPTNNPYQVGHGYGYTYDYQPVFTPISSTSASPSVGEFSSITAIIIALILVTIAFGAYSYKKSKN